MTEVLDARPTKVETDNLVLHHCAVADLHKHVAAESVDWIFTDPPYPKEYLPCFGELADFAAHALKPGGGLHGHVRAIPFAGSICATFAKTTNCNTGGFFLMRGNVAATVPVIWPRKVMAAWKPMLWYSKREAKSTTVTQ